MEGFVSAAYRIYRNNDGNRSTFGDINIRARSSDIESGPLYASLNAADSMRLYIIAINRNSTSAISGDFVIAGDRAFQHGRVYAFDRGGDQIREIEPVGAIVENAFRYCQIASAYHLLLLEQIQPDQHDEQLPILPTFHELYPQTISCHSTSRSNGRTLHRSARAGGDRIGQ